MTRFRRFVVEFRRDHPRLKRGEDLVAWCGQHDAHPMDCAELHHPEAYRRNVLGERVDRGPEAAP